MKSLWTKTKLSLVIQLAFLIGTFTGPIKEPLWYWFLVIVGIGAVGLAVLDLMNWAERVLAKG